jgi:septum formation inhibitor-activating ATPase MinD
VLLVDLGSHQSEDHSIFPEIPRYSIKGALQLATTPKFKENRQSLYHASPEVQRHSENVAGLSSIQLHELMPQLQSCDFDYIVFDMPTINKTSRTLTMAGMMDKVLLVLDAENTSRDALIWGYAELAKGRADVSCVFNKNRPLESRWLSGDI